LRIAVPDVLSAKTDPPDRVEEPGCVPQPSRKEEQQ
jgi:hypothetical protein